MWILCNTMLLHINNKTAKTLPEASRWTLHLNNLVGISLSSFNVNFNFPCLGFMLTSPWSSLFAESEGVLNSELSSSNGASLSSPTKTPEPGAHGKYHFFRVVPEPGFCWKIQKSEKTCYAQIHFLTLTLGTTRDELNSESVLNCSSSIKTENLSNAVHSLLAERDCKS